MKRKIKYFTLIELITAMAIFSVLMVVMMRFFGEAQQAWTKSSQRTMVFDNARVAMDLISRDLQCAYYKENITPFWHCRPENNSPVTAAPNWYENSNELLAFISTTPLSQNDDCTSPYNEIKYQLFYTTDPTPSATNFPGWLMRSVTGNKTDATNINQKYNFQKRFAVGYTTDDTSSATDPVTGLVDTAGDNTFDSTFTASNSATSEDFQKIIPYVTNVSFSCFKEDGTEITPDPGTTHVADGAADTEFPYIVKVELSLLDKDSWNKWIALGATPDDPRSGTDEPAIAKTFREKNERTFTKMIFLGERGQ